MVTIISAELSLELRGLGFEIARHPGGGIIAIKDGLPITILDTVLDKLLEEQIVITYLHINERRVTILFNKVELMVGTK